MHTTTKDKALPDNVVHVVMRIHLKHRTLGLITYIFVRADETYLTVSQAVHSLEIDQHVQLVNRARW